MTDDSLRPPKTTKRNLSLLPQPLVPSPQALVRSQYHDIYYYLYLNRRVDEQLASLYRQGKVVGGVYSGLGQ